MDWIKLFSYKWNLFGNYDERLPDSYEVGQSFWVRFIKWYFVRNFAHNFMAYWIGFKGKKLDYTEIWNKEQKWNLVLPFFSYRGRKWELYIGWRPDSKMFGLAFRQRR